MKQLRFNAALVFCLFSLSFVLAGEDWQPFPIGPFGTLNTRDNSYAIPANNAQDLLNVDLTPGGKSVRKRRGFGNAFTLTITTSPVHGIYNFFDSSGNDVSLFFNDVYMTSSINANAATVIFSTGPNGATYQCTDSLGSAYCANTSRTTLIKTNGVTFSSISSVVSTGSMVATCVTRLAMAGFQEAPSRIDFSADSDFTSWGSGSLGTSPAQFTVNAPGAKITHITYAFGRLMWFKDTSFGYVLIGNQPFQSDWVIRTISYDVGTNDNSSVYREGILYFRGKDGHIYSFDGTTYQRLSREISGTIALSQTKTNGTWNQTSQADWQAGAQVPSANIDTATVSGDVRNISYSTFQTTSPEWNAGTFSGNTVFVDTETVSGNLQTTFPDSFTSFRDGTSGTKNVWFFKPDATGFYTATANVNGGQLNMLGTRGAGVEPRFIIGSNSALPNFSGGTTFYFSISSITLDTGGLHQAFFSLNNSTRSTTTKATSANNYFFLSFKSTKTATQGSFFGAEYNGTSINATAGPYNFPFTVSFYINSSSYQFIINGSSVIKGVHTFPNTAIYPHFSYFSTIVTTDEQGWGIDNFTVSPQTFTYTSPTFDTGIGVPTWSTFTATTANSPTFTSQVSSDGSSFDSSVSLVSGSTITSNHKRYLKINSLLSYNPATLPDAVVSLSDYLALAYSTGTFYSRVNNAPNLTSWDTFRATYLNGPGNNSFSIRAATGSFSVLSSTPAWTSVTAGNVPTVSTGTYFQVKDDITTTSTGTVSMSDFTVNWFEGSALDKAYATYFDDKILWEVTYGSGSTTNNRTFVYDTLNQGWLIYDLASNGFLLRNNSLYFGSSLTGNIRKFGDVDNDAGSAINAYWKSKDFFGGNPFTTQEISNISISAKTVANSSMTVTYTTNGSSSSVFVMNLSNSSNAFINKNRNLPAGTMGSNFNLQLGNNAVDQPFEVFGIQLGLRPKTWIPTIP